MEANMPAYKRCTWDTDFFGYGVAELSPSESAVNLPSALSELKEQKIRLVYYRVPVENRSLLMEAEKEKGFYAGGQVTFERSNSGLFPNAIREIVTYDKSIPNEELNDLAISSGEYSRYRKDRKFTNDQFEKLYLTWIQKCADKRMADQIFTALDDTKIVGFVAVKRKGKESSITLISVNEAYQGQGIGGDLVAMALRAGVEAGCEKHTVVTYLENKAACRLFEKCGYKASSKLSCFHFWFD